LYHVDLWALSGAKPPKEPVIKIKTPQGSLRRLKVEVMLSECRRDSREEGVDEATHTDDQWGFACTKFVNHVRDYT